MIADLERDIPSNWMTTSTRFLFHILNGSTPASNEASFWNGDIFWATPEDIGSLQGKVLNDTRRKITKDGYESSGAQIAPVGSILLTTRAPVGNLALTGIPLCTNQGCRLLVPRSAHVDTNFFYYQLQARRSELESYAAGTTFQELSATQLKGFQLWLPPLAEQQTIGKYLDHETSKIDTLITELNDLLKLVAEKRQATISHAVTRGINPDVTSVDSGEEWIGNIPEHWQVEFVRWLFREVDERSKTGEEELLTVSHITGVTLRSEKDVNMFMAETLEGYKVCQPGDLVINTLWAWMGAMGVAFQEGIVSPAYHVYRPQGDYEPRYINYLVRLSNFAKEVTRYSKGVWSSRLRLYPDEFFKVVLPVPPIEEQREIVDYLDKEIAKLDELKKSIEETIELLQERRSALIAAAVTGKIRVTE